MTYDVIVGLVVGLGQLLLALLVLGASSERGTQLIKEFLRVFGKAVPVLNFADRRSFFLAALVAFGLVYLFGIDLTSWLKLLDGYDESLVNLVNALLVLFASNVTHDKWFPSTPEAG